MSDEGRRGIPICLMRGEGGYPYMSDEGRTECKCMCREQVHTLHAMYMSLYVCV